MASCDPPPNKDVDDNEEIDKTDDDVETSTPGKKRKRKATKGDSGSKPKQKTRSWVWDHFTRLKDNYDKANCNFCGKEMACPTKSGTTNMTKHLENTCTGYGVWEAAHKYTTQTVLAPDGDGGSLKVCKVSNTVVREASNEMLVLGKFPLAFIESLAWKHFSHKVQLCTPHSRRTATRDIVKMYASKKDQLKKLLQQNNQRLSLTTDI